MESYREKVLEALDGYSCNNTSCLFAKAVRLLGFPGPASKRDNINLIVESADIVNVDIRRIPPSIVGPDFYRTVRSAILECERSEKKLEFFISDVISKFGSIIDHVYPDVEHKNLDAQVQALTLLKTTDHYHPADSVIREWRKYEQAYCPDIKDDALNEAVDYRLKLFHDFFSTDVHQLVHSIISDLKTLASLLDAALLENDCPHDFFYYQKKTGRVLTYSLEPFDLYYNAGLDSHRILEKWTNRDFNNDEVPSYYLLHELREEILDYRCYGVWNMTRPCYLDIVASDCDVRKAKLAEYRHEFTKYLLRVDKEGAIRNLRPIFKDLYSLWGFVCATEDTISAPAYICWDMIDLFRQEVFHYISFVYFLYLCNPQKIRYDIYTLFRGVEREDVKHFLCEENHFMSGHDFDAHELEANKIEERFEPYEGFYANLANSNEENSSASHGSSNPRGTLILSFNKQGSPGAWESPDSAPVSTDVETIIESTEKSEGPTSPAIPVKGKMIGSSRYRKAVFLYGRLCGAHLIRRTKSYYYEWSDKEGTDDEERLVLAFLDYMFWQYLMGGYGQMVHNVFFDMIRTKYEQETVAKYARNIKLYETQPINGRLVDPGIDSVFYKEKKSIIQNIFTELKNNGYFDNPY